MKFNNCDLDIQLKKQQPKSVIQVSCSSLQGDCTKETVPRQRGLPRHCTTHSCKIILSKCVNMQNRSLMHFSSSPLHDCNVPPPPFCAAQPAELCCPNSSGEPARNSFSTAEGGQQNPCQTLASYLPPFAHLTKSAGLGWKQEEEGKDSSFRLKSAAASSLPQLPLTQIVSPLGPFFPPKPHRLCLQTHHVHVHSQAACEEKDLEKEKYVSTYCGLPFHFILLYLSEIY